MNRELNQQKTAANMDCQSIEREEIIGRYLTGRLSEAETEAFEQHYLGCQGCFKELQFRHATAIELKRQPSASSRLAVGRWRTRWTWGLAAAAVLVVGFVSVRVLHRSPAPQVSSKAPVLLDSRQELMARLAVIDTAPPYVPWTLRGSKTSKALERFQRGMEKYADSDYEESIRLLREAERLDPSHLPTRFHLGVSYLMAMQTDFAIRQLSSLAALEGNPYREESHWYLAKAHLRKSDLNAARKDLETVAAMKGRHAAEAQEALRMLSQPEIYGK